MQSKFHKKKEAKQIGKKEKSTHPITQITAPIRDKTKATRAKGNPIKKPKGLQSPIIYYLLLYLSFFLQVQTGHNPFSHKDTLCLARE